MHATLSISYDTIDHDIDMRNAAGPTSFTLVRNRFRIFFNLGPPAPPAPPADDEPPFFLPFRPLPPPILLTLNTSRDSNVKTGCDEELLPPLPHSAPLPGSEFGYGLFLTIRAGPPI